MNTRSDKTQDNKSNSVANNVAQMQANKQTLPQPEDNRPETIAQMKLQEMANNSVQVKQLKTYQTLADKHTVQRKETQQGENKTGLPDNLKAGMENLSGYSLSDVKVHYNSDKPAQLQALAYAQGSDIHVSPGQEKHLAHEAWHVVQQKQGRVKPTLQMKQGVNVNDDAGLEAEADVMGEKAQAYQLKSDHVFEANTSAAQTNAGIVQRYVPYVAQSIGKRVCVTNALADDMGDKGIINRPSRSVPRTHVVEFDNEPTVEYRVKPEEIELEENQASKKNMTAWGKGLEARLTGTRQKPKPDFEAEDLRLLYVKPPEWIPSEMRDWGIVMAGKLWKPGDGKSKPKKANIAGSTLATAHTEAAAFAFLRAAGIPVELWDDKGVIEQRIISTKKKVNMKPDYRIGNRISDAFRVTVADEDINKVVEAIANNVRRKRTKYEGGVVYVASLTWSEVDVQRLMALSAGMLAGDETLLIIVDGNTHHVGATLD